MNFIKKLNEINEMIKEVLKGKAELTNGSLEEFVSIVAQINTSFMHFQKCGSKIFVLSDTLLEAFQNTDVPQKMTSGDFQYPFDSFIIESTNKPLFWTDIGKNRYPVYVLLYTYEQKFANENNFPVINLDKGEFCSSRDLLHDRALYGFYPHKEGGMDRLRLDLVDKVSFEEIAKSGPINSYEIACNEDDMKNLINIFFNTVMYINEPNRNVIETEQHGTRSVMTGGKKSIQRQEYIMLKAPKNYKSLSEGVGSGELTVRFPVRGHWTNQAYGEKHSLRKYIWIHPYWKGPELSEIVSKPYMVA